MEQETHMEPTQAELKQKSFSQNSGGLTMPAAVVIAGVIIALAVMMSGGVSKTKLADNGSITIKDATELRSLKPISNSDHIRGDIKKAKFAVVEFSDLQCPYCKQIHPILQNMMEAYGEEVVWVYRHFPLESIHPGARPAAHASECVAELGGNEAFWKFTDGIFGTPEGTDAFTEDNLALLAQNAGVDIDSFKSCQQSGKYDEKITASVNEAGLAGAQGTPDVTVINLKTKEAVHIGADPRLLAQVLEQMSN